ncbi:MAG: glutamine amidotransferase [Rhodospirillales bacterium]|jgi:GMP synthase (glutamine-hydrolysing)
MPSVLALQHVAFEDLGLIEGVLRARGWGVRYCNVPTDDLSSIDPRQDDLVIVLGGPIGVYEEKAYPFLKDEIAWIKARLQSARPILGICLGAQLMACALGAKVYPGPAKEIGWAPIQLSKAGQQSSLKHIGAKKNPVLHWHGDTFDMPDGATLLASTRLVAHQAFQWGSAALGVQFHPEVTVRGLEGWFVGHTAEITATPGVEIGKLRADTMRYGAKLEKQGRLWFDDWLDAVT